MPRPTTDERVALDKIIGELGALGTGLTLDDFRLSYQLRTERTAKLVRWFIGIFSIVFMAIALAAIFAQGVSTNEASATNKMFGAAVWALALGGLGALSSIFITVLKLIPQQTLRASDLFEVIGRTILGCIFGTILAITVIASEVTKYIAALRAPNDIPNSGVILLLPFLAGFSITLVLNLFEKMIRAIELTLGIDDRRALGTDDQREPAGRKGMRRGRNV